MFASGNHQKLKFRYGFRRRLVPALLLLVDVSLFSALPVQADSDVDSEGERTPVQWLAMMTKALHEENYTGVYNYIRGRQRFDTVRITHLMQGGVEKEKLFYLNGHAREVVREGEKVVCYHRAGDSDSLDHELTLLGPSRLFNGDLAQYRSLYEFSLHGSSRIADRKAVHLAVLPTDKDRYGYRLWLDEETGLLLQSHLVYRGRVLEVFQFADVQIGDFAEADYQDSSVDRTIAHLSHVIADPNAVTEQVAGGEGDVQQRPSSGWKPKWLPPGFRQVSRLKPEAPVVFSDGITSLTVFVEKPKGGPKAEFSTYSGGTVVFSRERQWGSSTQRITIVGKVPLETARRVAESIEPVPLEKRASPEIK